VPTVLGGPHARSYPEDARRYFDYVVGFCDRELVREIIRDAAPHRPLGEHLSATKQPAELPGLRQRWTFLRPALEHAPVFKVVPILGSLGCSASTPRCRINRCHTRVSATICGSSAINGCVAP
jgi:hypothetical protein